MLSLFQHDFLEFVDDKVLADASNSIFAVFLGVNAYDAGVLLAFILLFFLVMEDALGNEL